MDFTLSPHTVHPPEEGVRLCPRTMNPVSFQCSPPRHPYRPIRALSAPAEHLYLGYMHIRCSDDQETVQFELHESSAPPEPGWPLRQHTVCEEGSEQIVNGKTWRSRQPAPRP